MLAVETVVVVVVVVVLVVEEVEVLEDVTVVELVVVLVGSLVVVVSIVASGAPTLAVATPLARSSTAPTPVIAVLSSIERRMVADPAVRRAGQPSG